MGESSEISLKVMRISRPMFQIESPIYAEEDDLIYPSGTENYSGLSNSLLIPNSVGDFYLGEPANFMVTVQVIWQFSYNQVILVRESIHY